MLAHVFLQTHAPVLAVARPPTPPFTQVLPYLDLQVPRSPIGGEDAQWIGKLSPRKGAALRHLQDLLQYMRAQKQKPRLETAAGVEPHEDEDQMAVMCLYGHTLQIRDARLARVALPPLRVLRTSTPEGIRHLILSQSDCWIGKRIREGRP